MSDVNFTPNRGAYKELTPFRYWCQKVLPLVYDDSISYYELLCKVVNYLNITMEDVSTLNDDVTAMYTAYNELQDFVNQYFTDLNIQTQIDNKLDRMAADGSLNALIDPLVIDTTETSVANTLPGVVNDQLPDVVEDQIDNVVGEQIGGVVADQIQGAANNWLSANITGSNALDSTLKLYDAAARSFSAGNIIDTYAKYLGAENRITTFAAGFWENDNGTMVHPSEPNLFYQSAAVTVNPGDKYTIIAPAFTDVYNDVPRYAFTDNSYSIISASDAAEQGAINKTITVPAGATKLIVNDNLMEYVTDSRISKMLLVKGELIGTNEISDLINTVGTVLYSGTHSYAGTGGENWATIPLNGALPILICFPDNPGVAIEVSAYTTRWNILATITDRKWYAINVPDNASRNLMLTYRGTNPVSVSVSIIDNRVGNIIDDIMMIPLLNDDVAELKESVIGTETSYGNTNETETPFRHNMLGYAVAPCKKATTAGKVTKLYVRSWVAGNTEIQIGEVDQLYLFVARRTIPIAVQEGEQSIDVSDSDIYLNEGEQILIRFLDRTPFQNIEGEPEGDTSFYYSTSGSNQLEVFGAQQAAVFGFGYTVLTSQEDEQNAKIETNANNIEDIQNTVSDLQATQNIVSDNSGNKYRIVVRNGELALKSLDYSHVLCVGNSYTIHPTNIDTEPDYANQIWWGHWAMAASVKAVAWTTLLENALKARNVNAVVTPVFGRRYETDYNTYTLTNPDTFTYWDGQAWQSLKDNLQSFNDVDCIVFFLGQNYSGSDWYSLYEPMIEQFMTWFPLADIYGCSASSRYNAAKDTAIQQALSEHNGVFINLAGIDGKARLGDYVSSDSGTLHQITNSAVANHFSDYGEYLITDRVCTALAYDNTNVLYDITVNSPAGVTLSVVADHAVSGSIISVFADVAAGATFTGITVTGSGGSVTVTDHGTTDYGRVFTFTMPASDVVIA